MRGISAQTIRRDIGGKAMLIGEMCLLIAAVFVMIGLARGITARLYVNDYVASFVIFLIVLLNIRGGIPVGKGYLLSLGGILSVPITLYCLLKRAEKASDVLIAALSALVTAGLAFLYFYHLREESPFGTPQIILFASLPIGVWCALSARRTFASCLFSAVVGGFLGITLYQTLVLRSGNIGGGYAFSVMWTGALVGLVLQYLFTFFLKATGNPRASTYFEAGEMREKSEEKEKKEEDSK